MTSAPAVDVEALKAWHQGFVQWATKLGVELPLALRSVLPDELGPPRHLRILFGEFAGDPTWQHLHNIPGAAARDLLLQMVSTQADCHMGSVEMEQHLLQSAPWPEDAGALRNLIEENLENAASLSALLIRHFPKRGVIAATQLLERDARAKTRVLNAFNRPLEHWVDLFCFVAFVSLCARFALATLEVGGFAPVAGTAQHLGERHREQAKVGAWGLSRIVEAGRIEPAVLQRYINRWVALGLDLFGWERSDTAARAYNAGLKGRVHERERPLPPEDPTALNDDARARWLYEVEMVVANLNTLHSSETWLRVPPIHVNRDIVSDQATADDSARWPLPTADDDTRIRALTSSGNDWILPA